MNSRIFVTGNNTGVGKTVISAILAQALGADYWKPVQTGSIEGTDTETVRTLVSNPRTVIHPEAYVFEQPISPHAAAEQEGIVVNLHSLRCPQTANTLVIEGAGGILSPLNYREFMVDIISHFGAQAVVVVRHYLGSINHTLLTLEALRVRKIPTLGIVFCGKEERASEDIILSTTDLPCLFRVNEEQRISREVVEGYAKELQLHATLLAA